MAGQACGSLMAVTATEKSSTVTWRAGHPYEMNWRKEHSQLFLNVVEEIVEHFGEI